MGKHAQDGRRKLYAICALIYLNSTMAGFDASLIGNLNALPVFHRYLGITDSVEGSRTVGFIFASMQIGSITGAFFLWIADSKGRKFCIQMGSLGVMVAALLQGTATSVLSLIFGRFILGFFSTIACRSSSIYLVELAPAAQRGTIAGLYNTLFYFGSLLATGSVLLCQTLAGDRAWRVPLFCQVVCPAIVAFGTQFVYESPRWLFFNGRPEEARTILQDLHGGDVETEMQQMAEDFKGVEARKDSPYKSLFGTQGRQHRLLILVCMAVFGHASGNNVILYYLPEMVSEVGIRNLHTQLLMNALYAIIGWFSAAGGAYFHDIYGRRRMLLTCTTALSACMCVLTASSATYTYTSSNASSLISIASIYSFGAIFAMGYTSMQPVYPAEVMTNDMRARGMALATMCGGATSFITNLIAPMGMTRYGYAFYMFYVIWDLGEAVIIHRYFVETQGFNLEELEGVFESANPVWSSLNSNSRIKYI